MRNTSLITWPWGKTSLVARLYPKPIPRPISIELSHHVEGDNPLAGPRGTISFISPRADKWFRILIHTVQLTSLETKMQSKWSHFIVCIGIGTTGITYQGPRMTAGTMKKRGWRWERERKKETKGKDETEKTKKRKREDVYAEKHGKNEIRKTLRLISGKRLRQDDDS